MKLHIKTKHVVFLFYWFFIGLLLLILCCNLHVYFVSKDYLYSKTDQLPDNLVGLVPGTSKYLKNGKPNPYFNNRMKAARDLWLKGKIKFILVSGDNRRMEYNEPFVMRNALIKLGVPVENIVVDYAGFRTLDSVIRSKKVFGQRKVTIISQKFQNRRAVFIARKRGIEAIAYNARDVDNMYAFKIRLREVIARVRAIIDVYILHTQPYFLGEPIIIR